MTEEIPINYDDTTENDKLRELIVEWRQDAETTQNGPNYKAACRTCADELEAVLNK